MELLDSISKRPIEAGELVRNRVTGSHYTYESIGKDPDGAFVVVVDKRGEKLVLPVGRLLNVVEG